jgi:transposase InsO family protein
VVAIYQRPNTSKPAAAHKIYPYLLGGIAIRPINQVWCSNVTYIPTAKDFLYLVVITDWQAAPCSRGGCRTRSAPIFVSRRSKSPCPPIPINRGYAGGRIPGIRGTHWV